MKTLVLYDYHILYIISEKVSKMSEKVSKVFAEKRRIIMYANIVTINALKKVIL